MLRDVSTQAKDLGGVGLKGVWIDLTEQSVRLQNAVMPVLTIRDVPEDVKDALARDARERGQSLQALVLDVLTRQADFGRNRQLLADIERDLGSGGAAGDDAPDASNVLAQARMDSAPAEAPNSEGGAA